MCGRYVSATSPQQIADYFGATVVTEAAVEPNFNVAPTVSAPVIHAGDGGRTLDTFRWGLIPGWAKSATIGNKMINARSETLLSKNAFKAAATRRRCIVPADAFYEWTAVPDPGAKKPRKQPWCIQRTDGEPFAFAGLFEVWRDPDLDGAKTFSFTILTREANEAMQAIHDRMPVMVAPNLWEQWLDPTDQEPEPLLQKLQPPPSTLFAIHAVSTAVNNSRSTGAELMTEVEPITTDMLAAQALAKKKSAGPPDQGSLL